MDTPDIDNVELRAALQRHLRGEGTQDEVAGALRGASLLLPLASMEPGDPEEARPVAALENEAGEVALPAFTHEGALREFQPEGAQYVAMEAKDIFVSARDQGVSTVLIDPASPGGIQIGRDGIGALATSL